LTAKDFLGGQNYTAKENLIFLAATVDNQEIYIPWRFCWVAKETMDLLGGFIGLPKKWCILLALSLHRQEKSAFTCRLAAKEIIGMCISSLFSLKHIQVK